MSLVCGSWIVGVLPAVRPGPSCWPVALMRASVASLITVALRSDHAAPDSGAKRLPGDPDVADPDVADAGALDDA